MNPQWTVAQGWTMHARVNTEVASPNAPSVVLVHGVGVSSRYMVPLAEQLAAFARVHAVDLPGLGLSEKPARALRLDELTDALVAWLDAARLSRPILLGNSFGCQIIVNLARRHPGRIARAILQGMTIDPAGRTVRQQITRWLRNGQFESPALLPVLLRDYVNCGVPRLLRTFRYALEDPVEDKLPHMQVPTLVVRGSHDPIVPQPWAEESVRRLPRGELRVVPGGGHTVNFSMPLEMMRIARPFLVAQGPRQRTTAA